MNKVTNVGLLLFCMWITMSGDASATTAQALSSESQEVSSPFLSMLIYGFEMVFDAVVGVVVAVLFYDIYGFPFIVLWLLAGGVFFTLYNRFINIRLFRHALSVIRGKYDNPEDPGDVTHFQALSAAVSATVGLGNIAGVAVAVGIGGPGAVVWMVLAGFLGMSTKFSEVILGHKYRTFDANGKVIGGAFRYLELGLKERGIPRIGKVLAILFAFLCIGGALGGGNMFQTNQAVTMLTGTYGSLDGMGWVLSLTLTVAVGIVLIGGISRIAAVAEAIVPLMALIYITASCVVIFSNLEHLPTALGIIFREAFDFESFAGGSLGAIIMGFRRGAFSNEAGVGSAPIAHAAAKTREPVREGCVALLEPFLDTVVICFMTGLVITITGVYADPDIAGDGVLLTSAAFATVIDWFPNVLAVSIVLFAYSTMITWSYYGERAWVYLFGEKRVIVYYMIFCTCSFFGGMIGFAKVVDFSDLLLGMAVPNLIGLYLLRKVIRRETQDYVTRLKAGQF